MDESAETLCRRIELYRRCLRQGVDGALTADYLREIAEAETSFVEAIRQHPGLLPPSLLTTFLLGAMLYRISGRTDFGTARTLRLIR
jgi:hypothetical protein